MSTETITRREQNVAKPAEVPAVEALNKVVENIRRDSQQDTQLYLEESKVPHGGE